MFVPGMGVEVYGSQQVDHYTHVHNYCFHVKLCEVFDETPLPVMGPTGFLTKGISFSPFMHIKWPEMGDLKPLNGTNLPAPPSSLPPRHPAPLLPQPIPLSVHLSFPRLFSFFTRTLHLDSHVNGITARANTNITPTFLSLLPYLGSRKLSKPKSCRAISNQSRQNPFQPETKDFGNARVYFTVLKRPFPIGIHYDQVPDFSQYAEATPSNIQSLVKAVADFEMELTQADKSGTQFIWLPMVQLAFFLFFMSLDCSIPFLPHLYSTSLPPCHLFLLTLSTPLLTLKAISRAENFPYPFLVRCACTTHTTSLLNTSPLDLPG